MLPVLFVRAVNVCVCEQKLFNSECESIQGRRMKMMQLLESQQSVTTAAEKAKNTTDLSALQTLTAQVRL